MHNHNNNNNNNNINNNGIGIKSLSAFYLAHKNFNDKSSKKAPPCLSCVLRFCALLSVKREIETGFGVRIVEGVHKAVNYSDYLSCEVLILNQLNDSLGFISKA